jgi:hypothetical protein
MISAVRRLPRTQHTIESSPVVCDERFQLQVC